MNKGRTYEDFKDKVFDLNPEAATNTVYWVLAFIDGVLTRGKQLFMLILVG